MTDLDPGRRRARYNGKVRPGPVPSPDRWASRGACASAPDPDLFFQADPGHPGTDEAAEPAKAYCAGCPVQQTCLAWAIQNREQFGVWGGTTARERRRMIRRSA